ncbi:MAG TPA: glycosyltransferase family 87 protein [Candidatus Limnocylindrales bacterium]
MTAGAIANARFRVLLWSIVGAVAWLGALAIGATLWQADPRAAGFDWELVVEAGRRVSAGLSPYDPALLAGTADLAALDLFYSYPPPVAQAAALLAGVPSLVSLLVLDGVAVLGVALVTATLARGRPGLRPTEVALSTVAILPLLFPVTVALVFGNVDVLYPLVYGAVLLGSVAAGSGPVTAIAGGIALALATVAKIHPGGIGAWLLVRGLRERREGSTPRSWAILTSAIATGLIVVVASLFVGGVGPWMDYLRVIGAVSGADVIVRSNIGPAAQLALVAGLDATAARAVYVATVAAGLFVTAWAAWRVRDVVLSLAIGSVASLILLPITWYHYPPALLPFAVAAILRSGAPVSGRVVALVFAAGVVASLAIALPVAVWAAVALVIAAVAISDPGRQRGT